LIRALYGEVKSYVSHHQTSKHQCTVTSPDKQASMHTPRFGTQSKQSSKQPFFSEG